MVLSRFFSSIFLFTSVGISAGYGAAIALPPALSETLISEMPDSEVSNTEMPDSELVLPWDHPVTGITTTPIPGVVQPYCPNQTQQAMNQCMGRWRSLTDLLYDLSYQDLDSQLSSAQRDRLETTHTHWDAYRESHCAIVSSQVRGGSLYPTVLNICLARLTNERIATLVQWGASALSLEHTEQAEAQLNRLNQQLYDTYVGLLPADRAEPESDPSNPVVQSQMLWDRYQQAQCIFERSQPDMDPDALWPLQLPENAETEQAMLQCSLRLVQERVRHLTQLSEMGW